MGGIVSYNNHRIKNKMKSFQEFFISEGVSDQGIFKAVFLAGGPGSGKSFVSKNTLPNAILGLKVINSDEVLEFLLKKHNVGSNMNLMSPDELKKFADIRDKAKKITAKREEIYLEGRLGLVIDGTGRDYEKIAKKKAELEKLGYDTYLLFVNTSLEVAKERNRKRDRSVSDDLVVQYWHDVQSNIGKFQSLFGSQNFTVVDNNNADEAILNDVFKGIKRFVDKPPRSQQAKQWIAAKSGNK